MLGFQSPNGWDILTTKSRFAPSLKHESTNVRPVPFRHTHLGFYKNESPGNPPPPQPCLEIQGGGNISFSWVRLPWETPVNHVLKIRSVGTSCPWAWIPRETPSNLVLRVRVVCVSWCFLGLSTTVMAIPSANFSKENSLARGFYLNRFFDIASSVSNRNDYCWQLALQRTITSTTTLL